MARARGSNSVAIHTRFLGLGTAFPPVSISQKRLGEFGIRVLEASAPDSRRRRIVDLVERLFASSGIDSRRLIVDDFARDDAASFRFFPPNWSLDPFPTTADRMRVYEERSVDLAEAAAIGALSASGVAASDVTHIVMSTCTGFFAPGPDVLLAQRLGIRDDVRRTLIGFMGCHGAMNALRSSDDIVRANPDAHVLLVSVELCSLHYQKRPVPDLLVANTLFGDGAGAVVLGSSTVHPGEGLARIERNETRVVPSSLDRMSWRIGNHGFEMQLSTEVPRGFEAEARRIVGRLLDGTSWSHHDVKGWAVHPGGRKILEIVEQVLEIRPDEMSASWEIYREYGNMSSATLLVILDRMLSQGDRAGPIVTIGFGPGLTIEAALIIADGGGDA